MTPIGAKALAGGCLFEKINFRKMVFLFLDYVLLFRFSRFVFQNSF